MNQATVKVDIRGLRMFKGLVEGGPLAGAVAGVGIGGLIAVITGTTMPGIGSIFGPWVAASYAISGATLPGQILALWEARYRAFIYDRFDRFSKGMGDWAPLAASTERRRRKGKGSGDNAILRDTGVMFASINPNITNTNAGSWLSAATSLGANWTIEVGFGGPARHPGGNVSIADIASFHQKGNPPHLPQRQIIVPPSPEVITQMRDDAKRILEWYFVKSLGIAGFKRAVSSGVRSVRRGLGI